MKRLAFFLCIITLNIDSLAQRIPESEVIFQTRFASSPNQITTFEVYPLQYEGLTTTVYRYYTNNACTVGIQGGTNSVVNLKGNVSCSQSGLEYIFFGESWEGGETCNGNSEYRPFANALYEIKIKVDYIEKFKFILDTRHNSLPNGCDNNCGGNDISIVYFINTNTVGAANGFWQGGSINPIIYGRYYTWWEIRNNNCSVALSKFIERYMPILLEPELQGSSPFIQWVKASGQDAESTFYQYDLQRSINYGPFGSIYQTFDFNETSYFDYEIFWNPNQTATIIQYRVVAIYNLVIDISNYREINTGKWFLMKKSINKSNEDFSLGHNYPNPFNPSTTISYQLPEDGYVSLIVYDALGREVSRLVDDFLEAGEYRINFNAQGLNSGFYFYTLIFNNYTETKQMLLLK